MHSHRLRLGTAIGLAAVSLAAPASAEVLIGLTNSNSLVRFDSSDPGVTSGSVMVTGLAAGDRLVGIDKRTSAVNGNGLLYGVAINSGTGRVRSRGRQWAHLHDRSDVGHGNARLGAVARSSRHDGAHPVHRHLGLVVRR